MYLRCSQRIFHMYCESLHVSRVTIGSLNLGGISPCLVGPLHMRYCVSTFFIFFILCIICVFYVYSSIFIIVCTCLVFLGHKNPATFVQHFPAICWDSAKTKGTFLLSILPRSCRTQWLKLVIKILPLAQPAAHTPPAPVREAAQTTQRKRSPSSAARSGAHAASRYRRARSTAVHGGAELAVAALAGASGVNHGNMLRDFGRRGGLTLRRSPHEVHAPA